ncbi:MAG TPA: peptidyl-prolyl cis-trans isomerase, partial [Pseudoxanthomonas sp.]|nr:peptidyl-prolyl cis-trans isomerase [Pseudoxanthomonas sp.]
EEVRDELAREQAASESERAYSELAGQLVTETLKNPTALEPAAQAVGLTVQQLGPFPRNAPTGIALNPAVLRAAFSDTLVQDGTVSDPIELAPNHSVVIRVTQHTPEQARPLDQVRDEVIAAVRADRQQKAAEAAADAIIAQVQKGGKLQDIAASEKLQSGELPGLQRGMPMPSPEANEAIFAAPPPAEGKPSVGKVELGNGTYAVFVVDKVNEADLSELPAEQREALKQQLTQLGGMSATQAYVDAMRKQFKVKIIEERL